MQACELETGDVLFYERFRGHTELKDRYFVVLVNGGELLICLTTTTRNWPQEVPRLATEFVEVSRGESCLPKSCFIDLRNAQEFQDTVINSKLRAGTVKVLGTLPVAVLSRLRDTLAGTKSLSLNEKRQFIDALEDAICE